MTTIPVARWCAALLLIAGLTGCQDGTDPPPPPAKPTFANWPEALNGLRFRWTAEPGIDLLTGPAVPLRAYLESHRTGDFTLNPNTVYPGFQRAVPPGPPNGESFPSEPYQLWYVQPFTDPRFAFGPAGKFYGNEYFHVLDLTPSDGGFRAYVCDGTYNVFRQGNAANVFEPVHTPTEHTPNADEQAMDVWRIELTDHPSPPDLQTPAAVTAPQLGPQPAPLGDIFGPWHITGANPSTTWGPSGDPKSGPDDHFLQLKKQYLDKMPHDAEQRKGFYTSHPTSPPVAEPAVPGWPGETA